jgi:hypothetical protein
MKWDSRNGWVACDLVLFVDDLRDSGPTVESTWAVSRTVASRIQYLGIQEASRKRRPPTRTPGVWAGGVFKTSATNVSVTVTQDKWEKGKRLIETLWQHIESAGVSEEGADVSLVMMDYKSLEVVRGFLVHLSMTFVILVHHLKGFHLALAAYFPGRNDDGWKLTDAEWMSYLLAKVADGHMSQEEAEQCYSKTVRIKTNAPPTSIKLTKHLRDDLYALREIFDLEPPRSTSSETISSLVTIWLC